MTWWDRFIVYASVVGLVTAGTIISLRANAESDKNWCDLIVLFDDAYQAQPPVTPTGRAVAAKMHARRLTLGC